MLDQGRASTVGATVQNAKKSAKSSHRFAIPEACVGVSAVTAIVIRETCDVVETGVRRDRAIDGRIGVQGSARVEVECASRPATRGADAIAADEQRTLTRADWPARLLHISL